MNVPIYCPNQQLDLNLKILETCESIDWLSKSNEPPNRTFIIVDEGRIGLADATWPKVLPVYVDFLSNEAQHRRLHGGGTGQAIAKAVGLNKRRDLAIWDATAGLGRDSFVMACIGATVTLFERNPLVTLLLNDGLQQLRQASDPDLFAIAQRMTFIEGSFLGQQPLSLPSPDVIYLDPMFPERQKSAKVKKEMTLFHDIVGADDDADALLLPALELAKYRVVVKRPKQAPVLAGKKPTTALIGKSSRFDIYSKMAIN